MPEKVPAILSRNVVPMRLQYSSRDLFYSRHELGLDHSSRIYSSTGQRVQKAGIAHKNVEVPRLYVLFAILWDRCAPKIQPNVFIGMLPKSVIHSP